MHGNSDIKKGPYIAPRAAWKV